MGVGVDVGVGVYVAVGVGVEVGGGLLVAGAVGPDPGPCVGTLIVGSGSPGSGELVGGNNSGDVGLLFDMANPFARADTPTT